ncbi:MAG TPA: methyltransferase domain-containing protein [Chitinophagaceae bacterium]|nr:methyltransferase domain-containing protein [Chitinophagaceae bacterium]
MHGADSLKFKTVFDSSALNDGLYFFLQLIYRLYPEDAFHYLIAIALKEKKTDEEIYKEVQRNLPGIKPFLQKYTYTKPTARRQRKELQRQTLAFLHDKKVINGYLQVGLKDNYAKGLKKHIKIKGDIFCTENIIPGNPVDVVELIKHNIKSDSVDLVTCYNGLHHYPDEYLGDIIKFIHRVLRKGGIFIVREYDVKTTAMQTFVSVIHSVMNVGANVSWATNVNEYRSFRPAEEWSNIITSFGFEDLGKRVIQEKDPTMNTMMGFVKE